MAPVLNCFAFVLLVVIHIGSGQKLGSLLASFNPVEGLNKHLTHHAFPIDNDVKEAVENLSPTFVFNQTFSEESLNFSSCVLSINKIKDDLLKHRSMHTLQLVDSWFKVESGILKGNLVWLGRYHECIGASTHNMTTQYCAAHFGKKEAAFQLGSAGLSVGTCFPKDCSPSNITNIFDSLVNMTGKDIATTVSCPKQFEVWNFKDVLGLVVLLLFVSVVLAATIYEYTLSHMSQKGNEDNEILYTDALNATLYKTETGRAQKLILAFSAIENTKRLLSTEQKAGDIHCLHGMRFMSMSWVILGHSFLFVAYYTDNLMYPASYLVNHFEFQAILNATVSVDSFFFLSGLLACYLGLRQLGKTEGRINVPLMYLLRYIRLTPAYAFCMLMMVSLWPKFGEGPIWPSMARPIVEGCEKYWWSSLLYFNNLYPSVMNAECYAWGWYLANDTQFYLLLPIFLILLYRKPIVGTVVVGIVLTASTTITGVFSSITSQQPQVVQIGQLASKLTQADQLDLGNGNSTNQKVYSVYISDLYTKPWCRIGAYLVGVLTGYILHTYQGKIKMPRTVAVIGWVSAAAINCSILYGLYPTVSHGGKLTTNAAAFYNAMNRPMWCVGLAWVTVACVNGYGGPVNAFLSWKGFIPLSRLTYCSYLIHPLIIWWFYGTQEIMVHYSIPYVLCLFLASLFLANLLAYAVHLLVEAPVIVITKTLTGKIMSKPVATNHLQFDNGSINFHENATSA